MAKRTGKKRAKKSADAEGAPGTRAARLENALAKSLEREAKAASRLEAVQLEVAVLRIALAEVVGEGTRPIAGAPVVEPAAPPTPPAAKAPAKPAAPAPSRARRPARPGSPTRTSDR